LGSVKTVPASLQDAEGIAIAHVSAWQTAYRGIVSDTFLDAMSVTDRSARWRALLGDSECTIIVYKVEDQVLGFISFGKHREPQASPEEGEVWTMYVHPTAWRTGVGRTLIAEALSALEHRGCTSTWVWVLAANAQAIAFYSACGFKLQAVSKRYFQLGDQRLEEVALVRDAA
jgi:ribosomal protein S18 acetylase RimI-like enzyme